MPGPIRPIPLLVTAQAALLMAGCGRARPASVTPQAEAPACALALETSDSPAGATRRGWPDEVEVALNDRVDPADAPAARNPSERMVFRQLYETLVRVDCEGRVLPGLAASWSHDAKGRRWTFTLRSGASFWDGSPVRAWAVAQGWASSRETAGAQDGSGQIDSVRVLGERELEIFLARPSTDAAGFARPVLSVTGSRRYAGWVLGSGPYRPAVSPGAPAGEIRLVASRPDDGRDDGIGSIVFRAPDDTDPRGALDAGADVLVSSNPEVLAYARALPDFAVVPLPWSRTYVVAAGHGDEEPGPPASPIPAEALDRLARAAVRADARPAEPPFWWRDEDCAESVGLPGERVGTYGSTLPSTVQDARIVYPSGDAVARGIAERIVALTGLGAATPSWLAEVLPGLRAGAGSPVVAGLDAASLARVARRGGALAVVVPVPRAPFGACPRASLGAGRKLMGSIMSNGTGLRITPLVDVRSSLVARRGIVAIDVDGAGTPVFHPRWVAR